MYLTHCFKVQPHPLPQVYTNYNVNIKQIDASFNFSSAMDKSFLRYSTSRSSHKNRIELDHEMSAAMIL